MANIPEADESGARPPARKAPIQKGFNAEGPIAFVGVEPGSSNIEERLARLARHR